VDEARQALALYQEVGDKAMQAELACKLGNLLQTSGAPHAEVLYYDRMALEMAQAIGHRCLEARLLNNLANLRATLDLNEALAQYDRAADLFRASGDERCAAVVLLNAATYRLQLLGDVAVTRPAIGFALDHARRSGDQWVQGYALLLSGMVACQEGDWPTAYGRLADASALFTVTNTPWLHAQTCLALARVDQENGRLESALAHLAQAEAMAQASDRQEQLCCIRSQQAAVWLQAGDVARAGTISAAAMAAWTATMAFAWEIPFNRSRISLALDRPDEAAVALAQAYDALEKTLGQLTPEQRLLSCRRVPLHQAILSAWQATQPQQIRVRLPRLNQVPDGDQPVEAWVDVVWTISLPGESVGRDKIALRRHRLQRLLSEAAAQDARPGRAHLAQALGIAVRTLAQDLAAIRSLSPGKM
jgi:ATP/maltotriose-dependent transcriptional regulator MalT